MTKLKLFHVVKIKENVPCSTNFRDKLLFVNSMKSLIVDSTKMLLPKRLVLTLNIGKFVLNGMFQQLLSLSSEADFHLFML